MILTTVEGERSGNPLVISLLLTVVKSVLVVYLALTQSFYLTSTTLTEG